MRSNSGECQRQTWTVPQVGRRHQITACLVLLLGIPAGAFAQRDPGYNIEVTPVVGYGFNGDFEADESDANVEVDDGGNLGVILNGKDTNVTQWEVFYARQSTSADTSAVPGIGADTDVDFDFFQLGGTYRFDGELARPYIVAGIGGTHINPQSAGLDSDTFWSFSIGTGVQFFADRRWGVRLEARGIGTVVDSESSLFCVSSGGAACAFHLEGTVLWQMQTFAGVTFRF